MTMSKILFKMENKGNWKIKYKGTHWIDEGLVFEMKVNEVTEEEGREYFKNFYPTAILISITLEKK
jgi:hypothetical protein